MLHRAVASEPAPSLGCVRVDRHRHEEHRSELQCGDHQRAESLASIALKRADACVQQVDNARQRPENEESLADCR